jgi:hypothetical protein
MPHHTIIDFFLAKTLSKLSDLGLMRFIKKFSFVDYKGVCAFI